jgi:1,2-diacylglycerol 3-beta-glucosyltransferase
MSLFDLLIWTGAVLQAPLLAAWLALSAYLIFLTGSALYARLAERRRRVQRANPATNFSIVVPAHNEALVLNRCLQSLNTLDFPLERRRVIVVADNCTDETAAIAHAAGATVYQRQDTEKQGKGYALNWAFKRLLHEDNGWTDAVLVFDADTEVDPRFLLYMDECLQGGGLVLQGHYALRNPFHNWRTALLYAALLLHNRVRPLARHTLGWTTLLKGNGMCFKRSVVERFGWSAYSLAEDIEFTTTLLDAGIKVQSVSEALLYAEAPQTNEQASSQRLRWEGGRFALMRRDGLRLLKEAILTRSFAKFDWAMDLLTPPTAILVGVPVIMAAANGLLLLAGASILGFILLGWLAALLGTFTYVIGGLLISGADRRAYAYLLCTPVFLIWKLKIYALMLLGKGAKGWVRTERTTSR